MSHLIDFESILKQVVILQHFAHGSEAFCEARMVGSEQDIGDGQFDEYWGFVKGIVSSTLLECGISLRIFEDTISTNREQGNILRKIDGSARAGLVIGRVVQGHFELTLRESCNKIIHARKVTPIWASKQTEPYTFKYWSGQFNLKGTKGKEKWEIVLDVLAWAKSVERFIRETEEKELTLYVGQDWF